MARLPETPLGLVVGLVTFTLGGALTGSGMPSLGGLLIILSLPFGIVTVAWARRRNKKQNRREMEESRRTHQDAADRKRELELYDMRQLEREYDRLLSQGTRLDSTYLREVVNPILTGHALGVDEFERREFNMRDRARRTQEIKDALFIYDADINFSLSEYDFEKKRFPVYLSFDSSGPHNFALRSPEGQTKETSYRTLVGYFQMENVEKAKRFRQSNPSSRKATIIVRPIGTMRGNRVKAGYVTVVFWQVLGLRLIDARTNCSLLSGW